MDSVLAIEQGANSFTLQSYWRGHGSLPLYSTSVLCIWNTYDCVPRGVLWGYFRSMWCQGSWYTFSECCPLSSILFVVLMDRT